MLSLTSGEDLKEIDNAQKAIAIRFEKSNEMIENCNAILVNHLNLIGGQLVWVLININTYYGSFFKYLFFAFVAEILCLFLAHIFWEILGF